MTVFSNFGQDGSQLLTSKEMEVARLVAQGLTSKDIAKETGKSHKTIENQLHNILMKLKHQGVHRRVDIVRWELVVSFNNSIIQNPCPNNLH